MKTLTSYEELEQALRLRHAIFHEEHHGRQLPSGVDVDEIDFVCDHLGIFDTADRMVASYRLTSSQFSDTFYAEKRFHIDSFLALPGAKIELGRACVAREYRNGMLLHLLWRGITEYWNLSGARYLFGSSSIRTESARVALATYRWLSEEGHTTDQYDVSVREDAQIFPSVPLESAPSLPPLFQLYLRAGAKVCAPPARDPFLGSADFFTVLDRKALDRKFERRYFA